MWSDLAPAGVVYSGFGPGAPKRLMIPAVESKVEKVEKVQPKKVEANEYG